MPWLLKMTLLVSVMMVIAHLYIGWRVYRIVTDWDISLWLKVLPFLFLISFYLLPASGLIYHLFWGDPDMLAFSQPVSYWFWFGLVLCAQLLSWLIILDLLKWAAEFITQWNSAVVERWYRRLFAGMAVLLFGYTSVKMIHDTNSIQIKRHTYASGKVPAGLDGFRIVHITDLQGDEYTGRNEIARYICRVNELDADLVIFTGDLISYGTDFITIAAKELGRAQAAHGTYAVVGDHDYWAGVDNIKEDYNLQNIQLLQDKNTIIPVNGDSLLLTGITEVYSKYIPRDSLRLLTSAYPNGPLKIMAAHQATEKVIAQARDANYQLLLAGHTHGGQLHIPFMFMTFSAAEGDTPYLSGTYNFGDMLMNVDNGLGFTLAPVRYNAPPTISVIDFAAE